MPRKRLWLQAGGVLLVALVAWGMYVWLRPAPVRIGSKSFTESVVLGEILTQLARSTNREALHRAELGGTPVLWNALKAGSIDAYVDYTGTITQELLAGRKFADHAAIRAALAEDGLRMSRPLGFNNTFALGMKAELASAKKITRISHLPQHPEFIFGFTAEFMQRADGWPGLSRTYGLRPKDVRGMEHEAAYAHLANDSIQVVDVYSTDADIRYHGLRVLDDDRNYFPEYQAVILWRADLEERAPEVVAELLLLEGQIGADAMIEMNTRVKMGRVPETRVAAEFLQARLNRSSSSGELSVGQRLWRNTLDHLWLVFASLAAAVTAAVPLGIVAYKWPRLGQAILGVAGVIQTVPSLAVLVFMIPLFGKASLSAGPVIVALFLYSLLPIVRNTYTGLRDIAPGLRESALALGLPPLARLRLVEVPLALPAVLAGIKTAAVINVGTATIGALIGAGGYGQPILTGLRLNNMSLILEGAIPAAVLALVVQGAFEWAERRVVSPGLGMIAE